MSFGTPSFTFVALAMMQSLLVASTGFTGPALAVPRTAVSARNVVMQYVEPKTESEAKWSLGEISAQEQESARTQAFKVLEEIGGWDVETGTRPWDPLSLSTETTTGTDPVGRVRWFRQAEIKHGRVCMAAFVGWTASLNGIVFPWMKPYIGDNALETWSNTPLEYQLGFILSCGAIEWYTLMGGWEQDPDASLTAPGRKLGAANVPLGWDPIGLMKGGKTDEERAESLKSELKNGRLAMIGVASLWAGTVIPGSVPFYQLDWLPGTPGLSSTVAAAVEAVAAVAE